MAMIPDDAVIAMHDVSPSAFKLFAYYCMRRNKSTGTCWTRPRKIADETKLNYSFISELKAELVKEKWIEITEDDHVKPLKGFGITEKVSGLPNGISENISEYPNTISELPNNISEYPKSHISEVRARGFEPVKEPVKEPERENARRRAAPAPKDFQHPQPDDELKAVLTKAELDHETKKFLNFHLAKGSVFKDWNAAWRNWMLKAVDFKARDNAPPNGHSPPKQTAAEREAEHGRLRQQGAKDKQYMETLIARRNANGQQAKT